MGHRSPSPHVAQPGSSDGLVDQQGVLDPRNRRALLLASSYYCCSEGVLVGPSPLPSVSWRVCFGSRWPSSLTVLSASRFRLLKPRPPTGSRGRSAWRRSVQPREATTWTSDGVVCIVLLAAAALIHTAHQALPTGHRLADVAWLVGDPVWGLGFFVLVNRLTVAEASPSSTSVRSSSLTSRLWSALCRVGLFSYSLYLTHELVLHHAAKALFRGTSLQWQENRTSQRHLHGTTRHRFRVAFLPCL